MLALGALSPDEIQAIRLSLRVAAWAVVWSLPFGVLAALVLARGRFPGKALLDTALHLPLILPPVVTGYALLLLFGRRGILGAFLADTFGIVFAFRWTGAAPRWVFLTVTLPLILPGILAGAILAFARSLGEFGATITFVSNIPGETQTLPSAIYTFTQVPGGDAGALRLSIIAVVIAALALLVSEFLARRVSRRVGA